MHTKYVVKTSLGVHIMEMWRKGAYSKNIMDELLHRITVQVLSSNDVLLYPIRYSRHIKLCLRGCEHHFVLTYTEHAEMCIA